MTDNELVARLCARCRTYQVWARELQEWAIGVRVTAQQTAQPGDVARALDVLEACAINLHHAAQLLEDSWQPQKPKSSGP